MALGKSHDAVNLLFLPLPLYFLPKEFYIPFTLGYLIGTFFLSPDLDLKHSKPSRRWRYLKVMWLPYQKSSRHRGMSHVPILGTFLRLMYLNLLVVFIYFVAIGVLYTVSPHLSYPLLSFDLKAFFDHLAKSESSFYFLLGLFLSEVFHVLLDALFTFRRTLLRIK
jgi:uncharacterized metal-binding protein